MKQLPDILTSAQFWSSIATMWAASCAWFTFVASVRDSARKKYQAIQSLISGIEAELDLIAPWASGDNSGYLQSKTISELTREHEDWFSPSRQIFRFDSPLIKLFTTSAQLNSLSGIIRPLVKLNMSIRRVFDTNEELRSFVNGDPRLYGSVQRKLSIKPNVFTDDEQVYMNVVFEMNMRIHQFLIGGEDSRDELCLYNSYRAARSAVNDFKNQLQPEPLPKWFWMINLIAGTLFLNGCWQIARWLKLL